MYKLDLDLGTFVRVMITFALLLQLNHLRTSKRVYPLTFMLWALASYIMSYEYYKQDGKYTSRVYFKIFNATLILLIGFMSI